MPTAGKSLRAPTSVYSVAITGAVTRSRPPSPLASVSLSPPCPISTSQQPRREPGSVPRGGAAREQVIPAGAERAASLPPSLPSSLPLPLLPSLSLPLLRSGSARLGGGGRKVGRLLGSFRSMAERPGAPGPRQRGGAAAAAAGERPR